MARRRRLQYIHNRFPRHPGLRGDGGVGFPALAGLVLAGLGLAQPKQPFGCGKTSWALKALQDHVGPCAYLRLEEEQEAGLE